jgi:hypothetical protein
MAVGRDVAQRVQRDERPHHVVGLRHHRVLHVDHRKRRGRLLAEVDDGLRAERAVGVPDELPFREVAAVEAQVLSEVTRVGREALGHRRDRDGRLRAHLPDPRAPRVVVDARDLVAARREMDREGPAEISVDARDQDSHAKARFGDAP